MSAKLKTTGTVTEYVVQGYVYEPEDRGIFWERLFTTTEKKWREDLRRIRRKWKYRLRVVKYTTTTTTEIVSAKRKNPRVAVY